MPLIVMFFRKELLALFIVVLSISSSFGDFVFTIDNVRTLPGRTVLVGVYAQSNNNDTISGFNLPVDFGADGKRALPSGFSLSTQPLTNLLFSNTGLDVPEPQITFANVDGIISGFVAANQAVQLSNAPTKLFDLSFEVGAGVPAGTILPIHIVQDSLGLFNVTSPTGGLVLTPNLLNPAIGSISVVPEPSVLTLLATSSIVLAWRYRKRLK